MRYLRSLAAWGVLASTVVCAWTLNARGAEPIVQGASDNYIAFEADTNVTLTNGAGNTFVTITDATASGGQALYQAGTNGSENPPGSFATWTLRFVTPGDYRLFYRWRTDPTYAGAAPLDPFGANSFHRALDFGVDPLDATHSISNSTGAPSNNAYYINDVAAGGAPVADGVYSVAPGAVGTDLTFKIGVRERGMFIDRILFTTDTSITEEQFMALPNSSAVPEPATLGLLALGTLALVRRR